MEQEQTQLTPEETKASLGLATRLGDQFLMQQAQQMQEQIAMEAPQEQEMPQGQEMMGEAKQSPEVDTEGLKTEIMKEVKSAIKEELGDLKDMIKSALKDDDKEE